MPMIEITTTPGALDDAAKRHLAGKLASIALELETAPGSRYGFAPEATREHLLILLKSSGAMMGRRMPLNIMLNQANLGDRSQVWFLDPSKPSDAAPVYIQTQADLEAVVLRIKNWIAG